MKTSTIVIGAVAGVGAVAAAYYFFFRNTAPTRPIDNTIQGLPVNTPFKSEGIVRSTPVANNSGITQVVRQAKTVRTTYSGIGW